MLKLRIDMIRYLLKKEPTDPHRDPKQRKNPNLNVINFVNSDIHGHDRNYRK